MDYWVAAYQFSLLTWSPYPGVSTMLSLSLTPLSTTAIKVTRAHTKTRRSLEHALSVVMVVQRGNLNPSTRLEREQWGIATAFPSFVVAFNSKSSINNEEGRLFPVHCWLCGLGLQGFVVSNKMQGCLSACLSVCLGSLSFSLARLSISPQ